MERREELQSEQTGELARIDELQNELPRRPAGVRRGARPRSTQCDTRSVSRRDGTRRRSGRRTAWHCTSGSGPHGGPGRRGCCRAAGAAHAASRSTAVSWRASPPRPRTRCCAAPSAARFCCGSRGPGREGDRRGRRRIARQPGARGIRRGGLDCRPQCGARRGQAGHRRRHQQRRRIPRADRRVWRRPRSVGASEVDVFMDSKLVVEQMSGRWRVKHPDLSDCTSRRKRWPRQFDHVSYAWMPAGQEQPCRPAGQRGDGRRGRIVDAPAGAKPRRRSSSRPRAGPAHAARRRGFCCCATDRPNCRCSGGIPAAATRR